MSAIEENKFVDGFRRIGHGLTKPKAVLCISAHRETRASYVASTPLPRTIHDFSGFPKALHGVQYGTQSEPAGMGSAPWPRIRLRPGRRGEYQNEASDPGQEPPRFGGL